MALRDWNKNGSKNDWFDNYMDYKLYQKWKENKDENVNVPAPSQPTNISYKIFTIIFIVAFIGILYIIALERNFLLSLIGWSEFEISDMSELDKFFTLSLTIIIDIVVIVLLSGILLSIKGKISRYINKN